MTCSVCGADTQKTDGLCLECAEKEKGYKENNDRYPQIGDTIYDV